MTISVLDREREAAVEQPASATSYTSQAPTEGSLASDEALQALRDKLTNG